MYCSNWAIQLVPRYPVCLRFDIHTSIDILHNKTSTDIRPQSNVVTEYYTDVLTSKTRPGKECCKQLIVLLSPDFTWFLSPYKDDLIVVHKALSITGNNSLWQMIASYLSSIVSSFPGFSKQIATCNTE